jgi:hypothetical protein
MNDPHDDSAIEQQIYHSLLRLNGRIWGISFGLMAGLGLFFATILLVIKGGPVVGPHLGLLGVYLPFYRVTLLGSFIGFMYAFVIGYGFGRLIAWIYNLVAHRSL